MEAKCSLAGRLALDRKLAGTMQSTADAKEKVTEVLELLQDSLFRYLVRVLEDPAEAEDVMQEVFVRLYCSLRKGKVIEDIRPWIFRVAHNLAVDRFRRKNPFELLGPAGWELVEAEVEDPAPTAEAAVLEKERRERFIHALRRLPPQARHCMELRAEGLTYREIAEVMGMPTFTLVSFLGRVIKKMMSEVYG
ncbi:MAG: RNA polymerase sigma factor [Acidobacteriota bacterium]